MNPKQCRLWPISKPSALTATTSTPCPVTAPRSRDCRWPRNGSGAMTPGTWKAPCGQSTWPLFGLALIGLLASFYARSLAGTIATATIMVLTLVVGAWFAVRVPDTRIREFRSALSHGEILLMVDAPKAKVFDVEEIIRLRHPEVVLGGAGWTLERLGI